MTFEIIRESRETSSSLDGTVWILKEQETGNQAEIWPAAGFNCYRWTVNNHEWMYAAPDFFQGGPPTRSGNPILFPFPNRIRAGLFTWDGKTYQLPINDPAMKNAIHGFVCYRPWRVVDEGVNDDGAWLTGEFHAAKDGVECMSLWPADFLLRVTYRLGSNKLTIDAHVQNPSHDPLPFGLGYHPYYCVDEDCLVQAPANEYWVLDETLPTGKRKPVDEPRDLRQPRRFADLAVDDVLTGLPRSDGDLRDLGRIVSGDGKTLQLRGSQDFREIVVFSPPHRNAVCIEPYTCVTDAINLCERDVDTGWMTLDAGGRWQGVLEMRVG